jgi:excinuclease ABC subunit A
MSSKTGMTRTTIAVQDARVHNLKNITVEIPRDKLIVITLQGMTVAGEEVLHGGHPR